jgi:hypothetical protein
MKSIFEPPQKRLQIEDVLAPKDENPTEPDQITDLL